MGLQGSQILVAPLGIVTRGVQLVVHVVPLRKKKPGRQDWQMVGEEQVAQGLTQLTQVGGSIDVDPYMPKVQLATQNCDPAVMLRKGKVELGMHLVQKVGELRQFRQLESHGVQMRVALLL
jgi:hypothetical protein